MASALFPIGGTSMNALAFSVTDFFFSKLTDHGEKESQRRELALKKLQRARDKWNEDRMKRLGFINKSLPEKNEARGYINNANGSMFEYCQVFAKQIKPLPPEPQLSDFYHPSEDQKMVNYYYL